MDGASCGPARDVQNCITRSKLPRRHCRLRVRPIVPADECRLDRGEDPRGGALSRIEKPMPSPFPGMDPYLESPTHWSDFHPTFIQCLREAIADRLPENYFARVGELLMLIAPDVSRPKGVGPDVFVGREPQVAGAGTAAIAAAPRIAPSLLSNIEYLDPHTEAYIEIVRLPDQQTVAVVELFSPTNKSSDGRGFYMEKRQQLLRQRVHIIELDLIRAGRRLQLDRPLPSGDYHAFISRGDRRPYCEVYPWSVRDPLPMLPIPLLAPDPDVEVDLGPAFAEAYRRGRYDRLVKYHEPPPPPSFSQADAEWIVATIRTAKELAK